MSTRLTVKQKEELAILKEYGVIITDPPSRRHNTMLTLVKKGYAVQAERFNNMFTPNPPKQ